MNSFRTEMSVALARLLVVLLLAVHVLVPTAALGLGGDRFSKFKANRTQEEADAGDQGGDSGDSREELAPNPVAVENADVEGSSGGNRDEQTTDDNIPSATGTWQVPNLSEMKGIRTGNVTIPSSTTSDSTTADNRGDDSIAGKANRSQKSSSPTADTGESDTFVGILAIIAIAILARWLSRRSGVKIPEGWKSPPGHSDIWYGPPLGVGDGGNGGFSEVCHALRKNGNKVEKARYILKFPRASAEAAIRESVVFEAAVLDFLEKSGYRNSPVCRGKGKALAANMRVPWYLMSCAPGQSLDKLMDGWNGRPFDKFDAGRMLIALCTALADLHKTGVCHRDIKPRNVFWDGRRATLIDFGSAKIPSAVNPAEGNIPGTDRWEAPEQAYGNAPVGPMADIYSFGLIFCSVVLSKPFLEDRWSPLRAKYGAAVTAAVGTRIAEIVFSRLLANDPQARIDALEILAERLKTEW